MRYCALVLCALALGACGVTPDQAPTTEGEPAISAAPTPAEIDATSGESANLPEPKDAGLIPDRFQGVWDYVKGTCAPESDLRMEVSASEIMFYESIGIVTATEHEGDDVVVTLAMEGEGETWEQKTRLSLITESTAAETIEWLATSDGDAPKIPDQYPSKRCEG